MKKRFKFILIITIFAGFSYSQIPNPPTLISPLPGASICQPVVLDWSDVAGATSYTVQLALNPTFTAIIFEESTSNSVFTIPNSIVSGNLIYYWRINASNQFGTSSWSTVWNFSVIPVPTSPSLLAPPNGAINVSVSPMFDWNNVSGATYYIFQLSKSAVFDTIIINDTVPPVLPPILLDSNTWYYWRVKSGGYCGESNWSSIFSFKTINTLSGIPLLIYPCGDTVRTLTPTLYWNCVPSASNYRVQVFNYTNLLMDTILLNPEVTIPPGILNYYNLYYWRVAAISSVGQGVWSAFCDFIVLNPIFIKEISNEIPKEFKLEQNYPNPFNSITNVKFQIINSGWVKLKVFDISGREVATLVDERLEAGVYEVRFDAGNLPSGIYFYRIEAGSFTSTKKLILLK